MATWRETLSRYDVEHYPPTRFDRDHWWYMFDGENPTAVDLGAARWRWTLRFSVFAAYVRRWWRDRRTTQDSAP